MQFIVFAAFAIVLSIPPDGPPWQTLHSPVWAAVFVIGQVAGAAVLGSLGSFLVKRKLNNNPAWLPAAQHRMSECGTFIRLFLINGFAASMYFTDWSRYVHNVAWIREIWGLDEMVMMMPFLLGILVSWIALYPADRGIRQVSFEMRLWASQPGRPVWTLRSYLTFMFRHNVLIIMVPMIPIVVTIDAVSSEHWGKWLRQTTGVVWADQAVLVVVAGFVFLVAPVLLRYIWHTISLPSGDLRTRLDALCHRIGLSYRDILIWQSDGMVVNAAVMGMIRPVRYILLSDGLLETMDDQKIEAVFGHEAGHVKHHHIFFYLLFAVLSMLVVGGISEVAMRKGPEWMAHARQMYASDAQQPNYHAASPPARVERPVDKALRQKMQDYLQVGAMVMIIAIWGLCFGPVSRRFEWQADLFGARSVTPDITKCDHPCMVHGTLEPAPSNPGPVLPGLPVCATAAQIFGEALHRIATLNGIPIESRSWRHSSIGNRINLLKKYAIDPTAIARLHRSVLIIKVVLVIGTIVGLSIGAWLYWPKELIQALQNWYAR